MTTTNASTLCALLIDELIPIDWQLVTPPDGIDAQWRGDDGEVLTLFAPTDQSPADLLAADVAALLATEGFSPANPFVHDDCVRGHISVAGAPTLLIDATVVSEDEGARRLVLQRPRA